MEKKSQTQLLRYSNCFKGQALVEFAIVLPILIAFIFGIVEFGRVMWVQQVLTNAARAGVRQSVLSVSTATSVNDTLSPALAGFSGWTATLKVNNATTGTYPFSYSSTSIVANDVVKMNISMPFSQVTLSGLVKLFGLYDLSGVTLKGECTMRKES